MFKYIRKADPIMQRNPITKEVIENAPSIGLKELWDGTLTHDKRVSVNYKSIRSAHNISDAFEKPLKGKDSEWYRLADNDYDLLKQVAEEPNGLRADKEPGYPGGVFTQIFPILASIMEAVSEEPEDLKTTLHSVP